LKKEKEKKKEEKKQELEGGGGAEGRHASVAHHSLSSLPNIGSVCVSATANPSVIHTQLHYHIILMTMIMMTMRMMMAGGHDEHGDTVMKMSLYLLTCELALACHFFF
jgi:hypothetical protein